MRPNITAWFSPAWWHTPLAAQQGIPGNDFDKPISLLAIMSTGIAGVVVAGLNPIIATAYVDDLGIVCYVITLVLLFPLALKQGAGAG